MGNLYLILSAFVVGIMVVIQGGLNSRLGVMLNNSLLATSVALTMSASITVMAAIITIRQFPTIQQMKLIPSHLWFTGGVLSFIAVSLFYYIIPRLGLSTAVTFGLAGQLLFAAIASHFGWFNLPLEPLSIKKIIGLMVMLLSVILIKY